MIEVPFEQLSRDALQGLIEEFITREGTDYGTEDYDLKQKVAQVKGQLEEGEVVISFEPATESCTLLTRRQFQTRLAEAHATGT